MDLFYEEEENKENKKIVKFKEIPENLLKKYNKEQREAIKARLPLIIVAGPGSGKTATIIAKLSLQIIDSLDTLKQSLILTFTNKAAKEILLRLETSLNEKIEPKDYYTGTFHGVLYKLMRENFKYLASYGFERIPTILDSKEDMDFFLQIVELFYNPEGELKKKEINESFMEIHGFTPKDLLNYINSELNQVPDNFKDVVDTIAKFKSHANDIEKTKLKMVIKRYFEQKMHENVFSFTDILAYSFFMIRDIEEFRNELKIKFKYIFVDEYQDTNPIQSTIIDLIETNNYCKIGDPYQSIYKFLGAELQNIMYEFQKENVIKKQLLLNYRSTKNIVALTNDIITLFDTKVPNYVPCESANTEFKNRKIEVMDFCTQEVEIINAIKERTRAGIELKDMSVMIRAKMESYMLEKALVKNRIPYKKVGGQEFYQIKEITYLVHLLKIISGDFTISNFVKFASLFDKVGAKTLEKVSIAYLSREKQETTIKNILETEFKKNKNLQNLSNVLLNIQEINIETFKAILKRPELDFNSKISKLLTNPSKDRIKEIDKNVNYMIEDIRKVLIRDSKQDLQEYLMSIALDSTKDKAEEEGTNKLTITTIHSAKGLEWNTCFVMSCQPRIFPSEKSLLVAEQLEEEKRLFYVAVSRAKEYLFISSASMLNSFISPFIEKPYINYTSKKENFNNLW